jgi:hypothetical protein
MERTADTMAVVVDGVNGSQESARDTSRVIEQIAQEISISAEANNRISTVNRAQMENIGLLQGSLDRSLRVTLVQDNKSYESVCRDFSMTGIQLRTKDRLDSKIKLHMSVFYLMTIWLIMGVRYPCNWWGRSSGGNRKAADSPAASNSMT